MKVLKTIGYIVLLLIGWAFISLISLLIFVESKVFGLVICVLLFGGIAVIVLLTKRFVENDYRIKPPYEAEASVKLAAAKQIAANLNTSSIDVSAFCHDYKALSDCMDRLIWLNEKRHVGMSPSPRSNKDKITKNLSATVNDFIDRSVAEINSASGYASVINWLSDLMGNEDFGSFMSADVKLHIHHLQYDGFEKYISRGEIAQPEESSVSHELNRIDHMEGHDFEHWCADLLRKNGFSDVEVTRASNDQGVDVLAEKDGIKYAVQCKCYSSDLGNTPIQEVNAGKAIYRCHVGAVMTNRHFTSGAKEAAEATGTLLWDRDYIESLLKSTK